MGDQGWYDDDGGYDAEEGGDYGSYKPGQPPAHSGSGDGGGQEPGWASEDGGGGQGYASSWGATSTQGGGTYYDEQGGGDGEYYDQETGGAAVEEEPAQPGERQPGNAGAVDGDPGWASTKKKPPPPPRSGALDKENSQHTAAYVREKTKHIDLNNLDPALKRDMLILRILNIISASMLALTTVLVLLTSSSLSLVVLGLYAFFFAILLFCYELSLKKVAEYFANEMGFFFSNVGRVVFLVFLAVLSGMLATAHFTGWLTVSVLIVQIIYMAWVQYNHKIYLDVCRLKALSGLDSPESVARRRAANEATKAAFDTI